MTRRSINDARSAQRVTVAAAKTPPVAMTSAPKTAPEAVVMGGVTYYYLHLMIGPALFLGIMVTHNPLLLSTSKF